MNKIYRLVWNATLGAWVVACEFATAKGKGKNSPRRKLVRAGGLAAVALSGVLSGEVFAYSPGGGNGSDGGSPSNTVVGGNASAPGTVTGATAYGWSSQATANNAVAIGTWSLASDGAAVAVGQHASAQGSTSVSTGMFAGRANEAAAAGQTQYSTSLGNYAMSTNANIAIGDHASALGPAYEIAIGNYAVSKAMGALAVGTIASAGGQDSIAFGVAAGASNRGSIAFGSGSYSSGLGGTALGLNTTSTGDSSVAIGGSAGTGTSGAYSTGLRSVSIGTSASASATDAMALGPYSSATMDSAMAIGTLSKSTAAGAMALGVGSSATVTGGIALGTGSLASQEAAAGLDPKTGKASTSTSPVWKSTAGAVSVGGNGNSRQITNVAAGMNASDAVNVAQLQAMQTHYYSVNDNGVASNNYNNDGATALGAIAAGMGASATQSNSLAMGTNASSTATDAVALGDGAKASVAGGVAIGSNSNATVAAGAAGYAPSKASSADKSAISATVAKNAAMDVGSRQITSVAAGTQDSDATNVAQLKAVENLATSGWNVADSTGTKANIGPAGKVTFNGDNNLTVTAGGAQDAGTVGVQLNKNIDLSSSGSLTVGNSLLNNAGLTVTGGPSVTTSGINAGSKKITNVAAGTAGTDGVNVDQLTTATTNPLTFAGNTGSTTKKLGDTLNVTGGGTTAGTYTGANLKTNVDASGNLNITMTDAPVFTSATIGGNTKLDSTGLTITGGPSVTTSGINAGSKKITNVAAGTAGTDGVNVDQLTTATTNPLTFAGNTGSTTKKLGDTLNVTGGGTTAGTYTGANLKTNVDASGNLNITMTDAPVFTSATIGGNTKLDSTGLTITGGPSVTTSGINAGSKKITNVAAGTAGTDGVNVNQLTTATTNPLTFAGNTGSVTRQLGQTLVVKGVGSTAGTYSGNNIKTDVDASGNLNVSMSDSPKFGNVTVNDAGSGKITGLTAGVDDTDAVNVSQLKSATVNAAHYYSVNDGGTQGANYNNDGATGVNAIAAGVGTKAGQDGAVALGSGSVTAAAVGTAGTSIAGTDYSFAGVSPTSTVSVGSVGNERTITNVAAGRLSATSTDAVNGSQLFATNSAIENINDTVNAGWNVTDAAGNTANIGPNGKVAFNGDNNVTVSQSGVDDAGKVNVQLNKNLDLSSAGSLTVGSTLVNNNGLTITNGPSVTVAGIDAGSKKITNVQAGVADTDGVNVSQLKSGIDGAKTHYYSVNDGGVQKANYNNDGATGLNALAAGIGASGAGENSVAMGIFAESGGKSSVALGELTQSGGESSVALGTGAKAHNKGDVALGAGSETAAVVATSGTTIAGTAYSFAGANPTSTVSVGSVGNERTITNVAAGRLSAESTDAVNGSQLFASNQAIDNLDKGAVKYDVNPDGTVNYSSVTLAGDTAGTTITNVAAGVNATDAVNVSQLNDLADTPITFAGNSGSVGKKLGDTFTIEGVGSTAGTYSGNNLKTEVDANGNLQLLMADAPKFGDITVNADGSGKITGVTAGTDATDAVNVSQLTGATENAVQYDDASHTTVTLNPGGDSTTITNLAAGELSADSTDAVNGSQLFETNTNVTNLGDQVENIYNTGTKYFHANSTGTDSVATGADSVAIGMGAKSNNANDVALGAGSVTDAAVGTAGATIAGTDYSFAGANPTSTVSVGSAGNERTITNVAAGRLSADSTDAVNGSQLFASNTAIDNISNNSNNIDVLDKGAVKYDVNPDGTVNYDSVTLAGDNGTKITNLAAGELSADSTDAVNGSQLFETNTNVTNLGDQVNNIYNTGTKYFHANSTGTDSVASGVDSVAIGMGAVASHDGSIALGANSLADGKTLSNQAYLVGGTATGEVNIGDRRISGLSAGAEDTDAVNVAQLKAVASSSVADAVMYDNPSHTSVTLNPNGDAVNLTNVAAGELSASSTDAVNGSQLFETNTNVTNLGDQVNNIYNTGTKYFHANSTGTDSVASGVDSVAIGMGAVASHDGSIALGANSLADGKTLSNQAYLVGGTATGEVNIGNRRITGLSAGAEDADAVNVAQLKAVASSSVADAVMYDNPSHTSVTLNPNGDAVNLTNVAAGELSASSTDAVNGSQLFETNTNVTNLGDQVNNIYDTGTKYFHANSTGTDSKATGQDSVAIGMGAVSANANDVALGAGSVTDVAVGTAGATIAGTAYSFAGANPTSTVSVGSVGNERTITNVAAGRLSAESTDAVNGSQLFASNQAIDNLDKGAVKYDVNPDGTVNYNNITLAGDTAGTTITNVAAGVNATDAVNVSQLNDLADTPITFAGNSGSVGKKLGDTFTIEGVGSTAGTYSGNNLKTEVDANGNLQLLMAEAPKFGDVTINADGSGKITGVTAGTDATDAVNVSQLTSATQDAVQYDNSTHTTITLNKGGDSTTITNLAAGDLSADSADAVNGSQLFETNTNVTNLGDQVNNIYNTGTKYFHANSTGTDSVASGVDSVAIGMGAVASHDGSIALGANSLADGKTLSNQAYLVGGTATGEVNIGNRRITGLSAGAEDADAVNVAQLKAVSSGITDTPITFAGNSGSVDKKLGDTFTIEGVGSTAGTYSGNNLKTEVDANGNLQLLMADAPKFGDVTINADGSGKITGVTAGTDATDAVNVSQLTSATQDAVQYDNSTHTTITLNKGGDSTTITNLAAGDLSADSTDAVNGSQLFETNTNVTNLGDQVNNIYNTGTKYFHANSTGDDSQAIGQDSVAIGMGAKSNNANDVALGAGSVTDVAVGTAGTTIAGTAYSFAGSTPTSTVSVGSVGNERTITNVAAGRLSAESTDAVNGSQLFASNQAIDNLNINVDNLDKGAVKYDKNADGTVNYDSVTLAGDKGTKITNVTAGDVSATSTDAINGSQLFETNTNVTNLGNTINNFAGDQSTSYTEINGRGIRYVRTNDNGLDLADSSAQGQGSTAVGYNATSIGESSLALGREAKANNKDDVALGAGSVTDVAVGTAGTTIAGTAYSFAGSTPTSTVSVGSVGNERTITNVAAGRLSADSTDAVNGSQLFASNQAIDNLNINVDNLDKGAVKYDKNADGTVNYDSVTLAGDKGTKITNVTAGDVSATSTDAINGSQLFETNTNVTNLGNTINNFAGDQSTSYTEINGRGIRYVRTNDNGLDLADSSAQGQGSTAVGYNATSIGESSLALGRDAWSIGESSVATGDSAIAAGHYSTAMGAYSAALNDGDVALGAGSITGAAVGTSGVTIAGNTYAFAGSVPTSTVSVGSKGKERTITNVAAGRVSADSTDAVNGSQLFATNSAIDSINNNINVLDKGAVKYDVNSDGTVNYNHITLAGGDAGTTISNVAAGEKGTDAVNVDQLNSTVDAAKTHYYSVNDGGVQGGNYKNDGATGTNSLAAGVNAKASAEGGVALGSDAVASTGAGVKGYTPATASAEQADAIAATTSTRGAVSVGDADNGVFRQITGVAAGNADSDAVNVAQLKGAIGSATANAVSYDNSTHNKVTLNGDTYNSKTKQGGTTITNVAAGVNDSDAVNMAQLNQTNTTVNNISDGKDGMFQVNNTSNLPKPKPTGKDSTAGGAGAVASADNSTAIGSNAQATHRNSVAIGANSATDRDNSVSVGSAGAERQITHVAAGTAATDAVNLAQLNQATGDLNNSINNVYSDLKHDLSKQDDILSAGIAGALAAASLPQPYVPGGSMAAAGLGYYRGQQALAVGVSRISDNGKWVTKLSANADSQGDKGASLGVGYHW